MIVSQELLKTSGLRRVDVFLAQQFLIDPLLYNVGTSSLGLIHPILEDPVLACSGC